MSPRYFILSTGKAILNVEVFELTNCMQTCFILTSMVTVSKKSQISFCNPLFKFVELLHLQDLSLSRFTLGLKEQKTARSSFCGIIRSVGIINHHEFLSPLYPYIIKGRINKNFLSVLHDNCCNPVLKTLPVRNIHPQKIYRNVCQRKRLYVLKFI